jgi:precorrin-6A/cobalt-precorrin-6A reductase
VILVLGGTAESRELAILLDAAGTRFMSSLAGRVARPRLPVGAVHMGGFGGVPGLRSFLLENRVSGVVDATHPFAQGMTANAVAACTADDIPLLRLERPGWSDAPGAEAWTWVDDHDAAASTAARLGRHPFLTVGRQSLDHFVGPLADRPTLVRAVDEPAIELPDSWTVILSRGPYLIDDERALFDEHDIDVVVTKDSGGSYTRSKLDVAAERGAAVVIVRRGPAPTGVDVVSDPQVAADWAVRVAAR